MAQLNHGSEGMAEEPINHKVNKMDNNGFTKSYWDYYLELEERMEETRRYIEYDENNFKT